MSLSTASPVRRWRAPALGRYQPRLVPVPVAQRDLDTAAHARALAAEAAAVADQRAAGRALVADVEAQAAAAAGAQAPARPTAPRFMSRPQLAVFQGGGVVPLTVRGQLKLRWRARFRVLVAGRRFGKTFLAALELLRVAVAVPGSESWYVAPTYGMARDLAWHALLRVIPPEYVAKTEAGRLTITLVNGSLIVLKGANNPDSLRGRDLAFVVCDEFADLKPQLWPEVLYPMLSTKEGGALFLGTPKGFNYAYDLFQQGLDRLKFPDWRSWQYRTIDGGRVSSAEVAKARANLDSQVFEQEYLASFTNLTGRVYRAFGVPVPQDLAAGKPSGTVDPTVRDPWHPTTNPYVELLVGMDFNVDPMTAVLAVRVRDECHVVGELCVATSSTEDIARELRARYPGRPIRVCPDPAGNQRHTSVSLDTTDHVILQRHQFLVDTPGRWIPWQDRINATNAMLRAADGRRRLRIHPSCQRLLQALAGYAYKRGTSIPDKQGGHDHITDALGYLIWQQFNTLLPNWTVGQAA